MFKSPSLLTLKTTLLCHNTHTHTALPRLAAFVRKTLSVAGLACALAFGNNVQAAQDSEVIAVQLQFRLDIQHARNKLRDHVKTYQLDKDYSGINGLDLPYKILDDVFEKAKLLDDEYNQLLNKSFLEKQLSDSSFETPLELPAMRKYFLKKYPEVEYFALIWLIRKTISQLLGKILHDEDGVKVVSLKLLGIPVSAVNNQSDELIFSSLSVQAPLEALELDGANFKKHYDLIHSDKNLNDSSYFQLQRLVHSALTNSLFNNFVHSNLEELQTEPVLEAFYAGYITISREKDKLISKDDVISFVRKLLTSYSTGELEYPSVAYYCEDGEKGLCNSKYVENLIHVYKLIKLQGLFGKFKPMAEQLLDSNVANHVTLKPYFLALVKQYNEGVRSLFEDPVVINVPKPKKQDKASK